MLSEEQIVQQIEEVLETLRPYFYMHGGNIELVDYQKGTVYVHLEGACDGCPASNYTLTLMVESKLKEEVPQVTKVVEMRREDEERETSSPEFILSVVEGTD